MAHAAPTILMVEDDLDQAYFIRRAFSKFRLDIRLLHARDGEEAVSYLEDPVSGRDLSLVLLDVHLPRMSGLEVLEWLRRRGGRSRIPVVMLSTSVDSRDLSRAYALGADAYFMKPLSMEELRDVIRCVLHRAVRAPARRRPCGARRGRVLLVDDDAQVRGFLDEGLRRAGFEVLEASDGREGLDRLKRDSSISVVVLDLIMPGMDGWQFQRAKREDADLASIPVVVVSGNAQDFARRPIDVDAFLPKPLELGTLVGTLRDLVPDDALNP